MAHHDDTHSEFDALFNILDDLVGDLEQLDDALVGEPESFAVFSAQQQRQKEEAKSASSANAATPRRTLEEEAALRAAIPRLSSSGRDLTALSGQAAANKPAPQRGSAGRGRGRALPKEPLQGGRGVGTSGAISAFPAGSAAAAALPPPVPAADSTPLALFTPPPPRAISRRKSIHAPPSANFWLGAEVDLPPPPPLPKGAQSADAAAEEELAAGRSNTTSSSVLDVYGYCSSCGDRDRASSLLPVGESGLLRHPGCVLSCATCFKVIGPNQGVSIVHGAVHHVFCKCTHVGVAPLGETAVVASSVAAPVLPPPVPPRTRPRGGSQPTPVALQQAGATIGDVGDGEIVTCTTCNERAKSISMVQIGRAIFKHPTCGLVCHTCFQPAEGGELKMKHGKVHHMTCGTKHSKHVVRCIGQCHGVGSAKRMIKIYEGGFKHTHCEIVCAWCTKVCSPSEPLKVSGSKLGLLHVACRAKERKATDAKREKKEEKRWVHGVRSEPGRPPKVKLAPGATPGEAIYKEFMKARLYREEWENACIVRARKLRAGHLEAGGKWLIDGGHFEGFQK